MTNNAVRIIGGQWRDRKIHFSDEKACRPTPDRVREMLFNWLQPYIRGRCCLDAFAGSGALGFEALSRGAKTCTWIEPSHALVSALKSNAERLNAENITIHAMTFEKWMTQNINQKFNLVFLDPPFHQNLLETAFNQLESKACLEPGALIYVEAESDIDSLTAPVNWSLQKSKVISNVRVHLFRKEQ